MTITEIRNNIKQLKFYRSQSPCPDQSEMYQQQIDKLRLELLNREQEVYDYMAKLLLNFHLPGESGELEREIQRVQELTGEDRETVFQKAGDVAADIQARSYA